MRDSESYQPLTVAQLVPEMHSGGVERGTIEVAQALVERGHRAIILSAGGRLVESLESIGATHITLPIAKKSPFTLRSAGKLRAIIRSEQIDIVHARSRVPAWVAFAALRRMRPDARPVFITTVHGLYSVNRYSKVMTQGDHVICVSNAAKIYVTDNYRGIDPARLTVIPRGIDSKEFPFGYAGDSQWQEQWLARHPALRGKQLLTLPGRITRLKGHDAFLDLLERLINEGHNVAGVIIGSIHPHKKQYAQDIEHQIELKKLEDRVLIAQPTDRIRDIYALSNIVYSLSNTPESFGRTTLEALSIGVPAIGYDHGGVHEILTQLCPAGLVPLHNAAALYNTTLAMLDLPPTIPAHHTMTKESMLDSILRVYESCVQERKSE